MEKIFKYNLPSGGIVKYNIPLVKVLYVKEQNGISVFWAIINDNKEPKSYIINTVWTGNCCENCGDYIGTTEICGLVCHYFIKEG